MTAAMSPAGIPLPPDLRPGPVIVGVDDASVCGRPLRAAAFQARCLGRALVVVHVQKRVLPMIEGYIPLQEDVAVTGESESAVQDELMQSLIACGDLDGVDWSIASVTGEASVEILRVAEELDAAVVIVGKKHKGFADFLHRVTSGSVSRAMVAAQKFPVLVVP